MMMGRERVGRDHNEDGFDFSGLGALGQGLGGLFKGIESLVDIAAKLESSGGASKTGELNLDQLKQGMKGVYGFTIKTAGGGAPKVETFGNIRKSPEGPRVDDEREPITDLFDEGERVVIIVEMPGIDEKDIQIDAKGDILEITANSAGKRYRKELILPIEVENREMKRRYTNGILEISVAR